MSDVAPGVTMCVALALAGGGAILITLARSRRVAPDIGDFLDGFDRPAHDPRLEVAFAPRMLGMAKGAVGRRLEGLLPRQYLEKLEGQLAAAGLAGQRRAGDQLAAQVGLAAAGGAVVFVLAPLGLPPGLGLTLLGLPAIGFMLPSVRLKRTARARSDAIFKDLPDVIDMLAVAVEAGSGFEAALALVCQHFHSPITDELAMALREMELGLPRREALQELKRRADLDVVRTFILALIQADALGIPIGRVLKSQATEIRARRRAWAREKAAKLPVKILFPLVLFIFPPLFAILLAPAVTSFSKL